MRLLCFLVVFAFAANGLLAKPKAVLQLPPPSQPEPPPVETEGWNVYQNIRQGISLRYPTDLELYVEESPMAYQWTHQDATEWSYLPPRLKSILRVGFLPIVRDQFSLAVELYVTEQVGPFINIQPESFLGRVRLPLLDTSPEVRLDGSSWHEIDTMEGDHRIHNVFSIANNQVYLFVVRDATVKQIQIFNWMLQSVEFSPMH